MIKSIRSLILLCACGITIATAQEVIPLPLTGATPAPHETYPEKQYYSNTWRTNVVTNVSKPSLTVYHPLPWKANGVGVVVCPGGGFMALSIESEGIQVAEWLADRGYTAFLLKYRLVHTGEDATQEFQQLFKDRPRFTQLVSAVVPQAIADGEEAIAYVREHAAEWRLSPDKIGVIGFSAGGTVASGAALKYSPEQRPAFAAPIYPATTMFRDTPVPADAPPIFIAAATDDNLGLAPDSISLYEKWTAAHKSVELHMFSKGGHGFGMRKQGLPSDAWIDRFGDWLKLQGFAEVSGTQPAK